MLLLLLKINFIDLPEEDDSVSSNSSASGSALSIPSSQSHTSHPSSPVTVLSQVSTPWSETLSCPTFSAFTGSAQGPTLSLPDSPVEIFQLFFTPELVDLIVEQTNKYACEVMSEEKYEDWVQVTSQEIEAFTGFRFLMGLNPKPSVEDYWKKNPVYSYPPINQKISRERYRDINRFLHFVDNSTLAPRGSVNYDQLGKIRPVMDYLLARYKALYNPGKDLSIDEAMIKFQGRSSLKQYMPMKPIKRGIKVWVLGDSDNGYFSRLEVYTGKKGDQIEKGLGARVVKNLMEDFHRKWYRVFFDNFFTSKALLCDLEAVGLFGIGTARSDRKNFPPQLKKRKFQNR